MVEADRHSELLQNSPEFDVNKHLNEYNNVCKYITQEVVVC